MKKLIPLFLCILSVVGVSAQQCADVFISEYIQAISNNRAMEIYNPTSSPIDLSNYRLVRWSNGNDVYDPNYMVQFNETGLIDPDGPLMVPAKGVFVLVMDKRDPAGTGLEEPIDAYLEAKADVFINPAYGDKPTNSKCFYHNGNDAFTLEKQVGGDWVVIDVFGEPGVNPAVQDPGNSTGGWTNDATANFTDANGGEWWTRRRTMIRKASVTNGTTMDPLPVTGAAIKSTTLADSPSPFDPTQQWTAMPTSAVFDTTYGDSLGAHNCDCASHVTSVETAEEKINFTVFPNPVINGELRISSFEPIAEFTLINVNGAVVSTEVMNEAVRNHTINTEEIASGSYLLQVITKDGETATRTIIIE